MNVETIEYGHSVKVTPSVRTSEKEAPQGVWQRSFRARHHAPLMVRTVEQGIYEGFNPVVAMLAKAIVLVLVGILLVWPEASAQALDTLTDFTMSRLAFWYNGLLAVVLGFCLLLVCLPISGRVKLGPDDSQPDHSTSAWLSMMFCAGIGCGILAFSVSEPVSHFLTNPDQMDGTVSGQGRGAMTSAMRFTFLHWGLTAWTCYAVVALALGLACHRHGQPLTMRSGLSPLFGRALEGGLGHMIDVIAILAIISGITTTIVLGLEQICSGISLLTGSQFFSDKAGNPPLTGLLTGLVVAIALAIASVVSGVERGVKWTSQLGILLAFGILAAFVFFSGGWTTFTLLFDGIFAYFRNLPSQMASVYDPAISEVARAQKAWQNEWTIFYWAWWIAFAPFIGLFLTRISRGRTIREFILGALLVPSLMCFVWFTGTGGAALALEVDGYANGAIFSAEHAFRIYTTIDVMLPTSLGGGLKAIIVLLFLILIVASSTAAIIAIKCVGAAGSQQSETPFHSIMWAIAIAAITAAIMMVGGINSIRNVMIISAMPFSVIMGLKLCSVVVMLFAASRKHARPEYG